MITVDREHVFDVFRYRVERGVKIPVNIGQVIASDQVRADTKAQRIYGHNVWTKRSIEEEEGGKSIIGRK